MAASLSVIIGAVVVLAVVAAVLFALKNRKPPVALFAGPPKQYKSYRLISKTAVSPNTFIFRFALPSKKHILGLPIGKHIYLKFKDETGSDQMRAYTPISSDDERGYFDLLIKVYALGKMSRHVASLEVGQTIDVWGPSGYLVYQGRGNVEVNRQMRRIRHIGMIAGGTGITPMLQIIRAIQKDQPADDIHLSLIFGNVTADDVLLLPELQECVKQNPRFKLHLTLDKPSAGWSGGIGFVTAQMIQENMPAPAADVLICLCGPKPMVDAIKDKQLPSLGYSKDQVFAF